MLLDKDGPSFAKRDALCHVSVAVASDNEYRVTSTSNYVLVAVRGYISWMYRFHPPLAYLLLLLLPLSFSCRLFEMMWTTFPSSSLCLLLTLLGLFNSVASIRTRQSPDSMILTQLPPGLEEVDVIIAGGTLREPHFRLPLDGKIKSSDISSGSAQVVRRPWSSLLGSLMRTRSSRSWW